MMRLHFILLLSGIWLLVSPISHAIVDANNNGLSDLWEKHFNSQQLFPAAFGPLADPDGDGWTNAQEAAAGTDPRDANPPDGFLSPSINCIPAVYYTDPDTNITETVSPQTMAIVWSTLPGKQYTLLYSTDLLPTNWQPVDEPSVDNGFTIAYYMPITQENGSTPDKLFWRVAITDPVPAFDSDSDGLTNYEEYLAGTDPVISDSDGDTLSDYAELIAGTNPTNADEDGDGLTDPFEIAAGTSSSNQDSDGDAIPDSIDSQPLLSAQAFADVDGDGISDSDDSDNNNPRGQKPSIGSETASGNPLSDVATGEDFRFVLTVSNPAGPAPSASDLTVFLNGTQEAANITPIAEPSGVIGALTTRRFLLSWDAKVTTGYPAQTLQNISLRFQDSQHATTWLNLARIDVAEWEGMIAGMSGDGLNFSNYPYALVISHHRGVKQRAEHLVYGSAIYYRGPKTIPLLTPAGTNTGTSAQIGAQRYPLFIISKSGSAYVVERTLDISDPMAFPHYGLFFVNQWSTDISMLLSTVGSITIPSGEIGFQPVPQIPDPAGSNFGVQGTSFIDGEEKTIYSGVWSYREPIGYWRQFSGLVFFNGTDYEGEPYRDIDGTSGVTAYIGATITPHSAGTLEYPGLPLSPPGFPPAPYSNYTYHTPLLPIQSEQWHKLVLKVGPDAGALSNGITLKLGTGESGENAPQSGFSLQVENSGSFSPLTLTGGKVDMLPTSDLYQKLTSPEGLTLYLKRDDTVTEFHRLGLDLIPKRSTYPIQRIAALDLLRVEVEQEGYMSAKGIRFCRWLDSFSGNDLKPDCANNDRDRFRIRIPAVLPNLTKIHIKSSGLLTAVIDGQWVSKSTDGDYDVTMTEENGAMVSKWMLLVSDGDDDVGYNGIGTAIGPNDDNGPNDQTLLANFDSPIEVTLPEYQNAKVVFAAQKPLGDVEIQPYYLSPSGDVPPNIERFITNHLEKMKEIYRHIGVRVGNYGIVGKTVPQSWFDADSNEVANYFTPSESNLARAAVRSMAVPGKQIRIGFVDAKLMDYGANLWDPPIRVRGFTDKGTDGIIVSIELNDARRILGVTAHEVGHALGLDHTETPSSKRWLMRGNPGEPIIWRNDLPDSKRFMSGDFDIIRNSQSFYVPN